jgi:hypothetical protein
VGDNKGDKKMGNVAIVHLSDIHIRSARDEAVRRISLAGKAAQRHLKKSDTVIAMITGDIAFSGKPEEYDVALSACKELASILQQQVDQNVSWILVPGNHDGTFKETSRTRSNNIDALIREGEKAIDDSVIETCISPQRHYFDFEEKLVPPSNFVHKDSLLGIKELRVGDKLLSFWEINASWMSKVPEKPGELVFPIGRYEHLLQRPSDYRFAVLHHPLNWYAQDSYHRLRTILTTQFCAIFSGHEHIQNGHLIQRLGDQFQAAFIESGTLGPHEETTTPSFSITCLDADTGELRQRRLNLSSNPEGFSDDPSFDKTIKVQLHKTRPFEPTPETRDRLEELGAPFAHPSRDILRLTDVYVEPTFSKFSLDDDTESNISSTDIYSRLPNIGRLLIRGDEHYGKTCFLSRLFLQALSANLVPITLTARDVSTGTDEKRDKTIEERVSEIYGAKAVDAFRKLEKRQILVLIDDIDRLGVNVEQYSRALTYLSAKFENVVITVSERFDVSLLGSSEVAQLLANYQEFRMLGFSYAMRTDLIQRWFELDTTLNRSQIEAKVHEAQTQIDHAVAKALVPSTAFNTLMILNALQVTEKSQVVDAGVAQHYDMLIRRRLSEHGTPAKAFDGIYAYLSHMAWWLKEKQITSLDSSELDTFSRHFSQTVHPIDAATLTPLLTRARILAESDGSYQFRHPSARYFFLAHFIAEHAGEDDSVKNFALGACKKLYRKENANLIVFLASKTASKWIIKEVAAVLSELLKEVAPFSITTDSKTLNSWITETAKLAVDDTGNQKENRRKHREREEEARAIENGGPETPEVESVSQLDMFTQINLVFKTSEILGLILKSKYGSLDSRIKQEILTQLFEGPLRAISFFLNEINEQPEALLEYLSSHWEDKLPNTTKEQRIKLAQKFVYFALGAYSQALLQRQGEIIGSPDLSTYITALLDQAITQEQSGAAPDGSALTYRLLGTAARLSYPGDIPHSEIERLAKDLRGNSFGSTLLQGLVAHHLYMFSVGYATRQKLAAVVNLDLKKQLSNEVTARDAKSVVNRRHHDRNPQSLLVRLSKSFFSRNKSAMDKVKKEKDSPTKTDRETE